MDATVEPSAVRGDAHAPPSKSYTHRAVLAAGTAGGALVHRPLRSADTRATLRAVDAFGGDWTEDADDDAIEVDGFDGTPAVPADVLDCGNSGTTTRLVAGTAALADGTTVLTGDRSLRSRPHGPLLDALAQLGARAESTRGNGQAPLVVTGPIDGGDVSMRGDVSSQFVTALLMAGAVTDEGIDLELTTELRSRPYVDVTVDVLDHFGVTVEEIDAGFRVPGGQYYEPRDGEYHVPGDFSSASYLLAAGALAADDELRVGSAYPNPQGDTAIVGILDRMGANVEWDRENGVLYVRKSALDGVEVSVADTPDLLPTVAVLGAAARGTTTITDAEHVRLKETDRVSAMASELRKLGASVEERDDELVVHGGDTDLQGARVDGHRDHRVVMSLAIAGLVAEGRTVVSDAEHVDVSFPGFFDTLYDLGASVSVDDDESLVSD